MVVRDLRVYAVAIDVKIYHYRDKNGLECGVVIHLIDENYRLIEIKLGEKAINESSKNLFKLVEKIDTSKIKEPSFMMILTAVGDLRINVMMVFMWSNRLLKKLKDKQSIVNHLD